MVRSLPDAVPVLRQYAPVQVSAQVLPPVPAVGLGQERARGPGRPLAQ